MGVIAGMEAEEGDKTGSEAFFFSTLPVLPHCFEVFACISGDTKPCVKSQSLKFDKSLAAALTSFAVRMHLFTMDSRQVQLRIMRESTPTEEVVEEGIDGSTQVMHSDVV